MSYKQTVSNEAILLNSEKDDEQPFEEPKKKQHSQEQNPFNKFDAVQEKEKQREKAKKKFTAENGSVFFDNAQLKLMVDQKFEHVHSGGPNRPSIFQNMEILLKNKD
jgi:hypothetical protein